VSRRLCVNFIVFGIRSVYEKGQNVGLKGVVAGKWFRN
jgi:hypothetical protein